MEALPDDLVQAVISISPQTLPALAATSKAWRARCARYQTSWTRVCLLRMSLLWYSAPPAALRPALRLLPNICGADFPRPQVLREVDIDRFRQLVAVVWSLARPTAFYAATYEQYLHLHRTLPPLYGVNLAAPGKEGWRGATMPRGRFYRYTDRDRQDRRYTHAEVRAWFA